MKENNFWVKTSNYSIIISAIVLIAMKFFRKYLDDIINPVLVVGGAALSVFLMSELMKIILKKKSND